MIKPKKKSSGSLEARVGIFWLLGADRLIFDLTPISHAQPYGPAMTHPRGHLAHWTALQRCGRMAPDVEYESYPRGRVSFFPQENRFRLFADPCILAKPAVVRQIMATMHLPKKKTEILGDVHYRCPTCMGGEAMD